MNDLFYYGARQMKRCKINSYLFLYFIIPLSIITAQLTWAGSLINNTSSIYDTSINWDDESGKAKLLENVAQWDNTTITLLFDVYKHPEKHNLPNLKSTQAYNVQFINVFWGPQNNPFSKNSRPAKVFVFINSTSSNHPINNSQSTFSMAPLIKNKSDGNYYVFDRNKKQPMLLNEWVMKSSDATNTPTIRFNVCSGYGSLPNESCDDVSYQSETESMLEDFDKTLVNTKQYNAHRNINEDWKTKIRHPKSLSMNKSIVDTSIDWNNSSQRNTLLKTVSTWPNYKIIQENFEKLRDLRYFSDRDHSHFLRRISWLYPDDGCWTRASAVIRDLFGPFNNPVNDDARPSKVFAFGNLCANTTNASDGYVSWWYHTAPIIRDALTNQTYVLDPSIDPRQPIPMEKWVKFISANSGACSDSDSSVAQFNICTGYGTTPYDTCNSKYSTETSSMLRQPYYQDAERTRQIELGRDADAVLGNQPPW